MNISKNYLSSLKASEVFEGLNIWSLEFDKDFNVLSIEEKPKQHEFPDLKEIPEIRQTDTGMEIL